MNRVTRNSVIAVVAASGAMAVAGSAYADSSANGSTAGSPGVLSGNTIQLPVHVPVNVCGNTVNVVGLLNPAAGNSCANTGGTGGANGTGAQAAAEGKTTGSPGVISGNGVQLPVHLPVNVSGNTVNAAGVLNPVFGNTSVNGGSSVTTPPKTEQPGTPTTPPVKTPPVKTPPVKTPPVKTVPPVKKPPVPVNHPQPRPGHTITVHPGTTPLAHTGADGMLPVAGASVALLLGGTVLRRRFRATAAR
ncbi:chaplin [Streptomyces sp. NPDC101165]|uniref:chaplin n=1 Tax=Streptomyces sp. NPDC101165 TaxID=3366119 RepID=UPI003813A186